MLFMCSRYVKDQTSSYIHTWSVYVLLLVADVCYCNGQLFVANENKPHEIVTILVTNRSKLLRLLAAFVHPGSKISLYNIYLSLFEVDLQIKCEF